MGWWKRFKDGLSANPNASSTKGNSTLDQQSKPDTLTGGLSEKTSFSDLNALNSSKTLKFFQCPIFLDIETTGLHSDDRVVSLSLVRCLFEDEKPKVHAMNLVFDPLKKSHPMAENVHKLNDWMLRHQDVFGQHITEIAEMIESGDCLVAHNANFDVPFLEREFERWGRSMPQKPVFCTMVEARRQGWYPATLKACAERIGIQRQSAQHLAIEDALICMALWWNWLGLGSVQSNPERWPKFSNLRPFPERPDNLPRRNNKKKLATFYQMQPGEE
ncbi:3'-5' exonuclease [Gluconobacter albidus]|uniref:3'-5' exonuclease n=1 Tax=Gluconobacter albidus TaxID=318683 RepID=UPI0030A53EC3